MKVSGKRPDYQAYLLRLWREGEGDGAAVWRFSLEDSRTGAQRGFPDFDALIAFLADQLEHEWKG